MEADQLIATLGLQRHPEGGWYRELHRSEQQVQRTNDGQLRSGLTVIAFLLRSDERSRWHRVLGADELWQHVAGDPLELFRLAPQGGTVDSLRLGDPDPRDPSQASLQLIPAGWWQAARSLGAWSLMHCVVGPGFSFDDFTLMADLAALDHPPGVDSRWL